MLQDLYTSIKGEKLYHHEFSNIPALIISKSIKNQKDNFILEKSYEEVHRRDLPKHVNNIQSHHFLILRLKAPLAILARNVFWCHMVSTMVTST